MLKNNTQISILEEHPSVKSFLLKLNISRSQLKKSKIPKKFLENRVKAHQEIEIPLNLINQGIIPPSYQGPEIEVIFNDELILGVNKPPNIHCLPIHYDEPNNVLSFLRERLFLKKTNFCFDTNCEGGLLYRLDYETSGVLFFSKRKEIYLKVRENFNELTKSKEYLCIVEGKFNQPGIHKHKFSGFGPKKSKIRIDGNGLLGEGILEAELLSYKESKNLSLLKIKLFSGIRHQIRAQLAYLGFPILGDLLYGGKFSERLFLHAYKYSIFIDGKNYQIESKKAFLFDGFFNLNSIL